MQADEHSLFFLPGTHLYPLDFLAAHANAEFAMVEDARLCNRRPYHQQKLALIIAAMREHAAALRAEGFTVHYFSLADGYTIRSALTRLLTQRAYDRLLTFEVADASLRRCLHQLSAQHEMPWTTVGDPGFLCSREDFAEFVGTKRHLRMAQFYKRQRTAMEIMVDAEGKPHSGQWSFDAENRRKLPRKQAVPELPSVRHSDTTRAAMSEIAVRFSHHPGKASQLWVPTSRATALAWLNTFLRERLVGFGTYEDAITTRSASLFHSALSPLLNLGLLTPREVVQAVLAFAAEHDTPINDVEGLIRQIIGWREFVRGVYDHFGDAMRHANRRGHERRLTDHWHNANTGIPPLDAAIRHQRDLGWNHHINRLMVIANLMNLSEIHPEAVFDYFMTYYIDAYDWVMVPNVYGMGLNSDGGVFATKPYICGSNYLLKMSDFPRGDWCDIVDGLYWRFVANNLSELQGNQRMAFFSKGLQQLDGERKQRIFSAADAFLERCTSAAPT